MSVLRLCVRGPVAQPPEAVPLRSEPRNRPSSLSSVDEEFAHPPGGGDDDACIANGRLDRHIPHKVGVCLVGIHADHVMHIAGQRHGGKSG